MTDEIKTGKEIMHEVSSGDIGLEEEFVPLEALQKQEKEMITSFLNIVSKHGFSRVFSDELAKEILGLLKSEEE